MKKFLTVLMALLLCLSLCACTDDGPRGRTLFTFDGEIVKEEEFIFSFRNIITYFEGMFETSFSEMYDIELGDGKTLAELCETYALQEVGYAAVVRKIIKDNNIAWSADHEQHYSTMMDYYVALDGSVEALEEKLVSNGMTLEMLENSVRQYVYLSAAADYLFENGILTEPTEAEVQKAFNERYAKIKTVFFSFEDKTEKEIDALYIKIAQIRIKLENGESIDSLLSEGDKESGEYLISDSENYDADLVTAVFGAEAGKVSEVKIDSGYHIFVREELTEDDLAEHFDSLLDAMKDELFTAHIDKLYNAAEMTADNKLYDKIVKGILDEY